MSELQHLRSAKLSTVVDRFLLDRQVANQAPRTIEAYRQRLRRFTDWAEQRGVESVADLSGEIIAGYRRYLFHLTSEQSGKSLTATTQSLYLIALRCLLRWLLKQKLIDQDLGGDIELPKEKARRLGEYLTLDEVAAMLSVPDLDTPLGLRNRAMLEVFYSTAIRVSELVSLTIHDIDRDRGLLVIRHGKGDKDRLAPISNGAMSWLDKYLSDVRGLFDKGQAGTTLFLSYLGTPLVRQTVTLLVGEIKQAAGSTSRAHVICCVTVRRHR